MTTESKEFKFADLPTGTNLYRGKVSRKKTGADQDADLKRWLTADHSIYGFMDPAAAEKNYIEPMMEDLNGNGKGFLLKYTLQKPVHLWDVGKEKFNKLYPLIEKITGQPWDDSDPTAFDLSGIDGFIGREEWMPTDEVYLAHPLHFATVASAPLTPVPSYTDSYDGYSDGYCGRCGYYH